MNKTFSIIIPTYNGEKTVGELLNKLSIITSNYSTEVIIIDSESTDMTLDIAKNFKKKISDLKIISIKKKDFNHGKTRNLGVKMSKGKYVCFFSQDAIPISKNIFYFYLKDFTINNKIVAIFGKNISNDETPLIQKLENDCRWERLDRYVDKNGILIQSLKKPFVEYSEKNKFLWYFFSNTCSCFKRNYLIAHPFQEVDWGEDQLKGKEIIESGFIKVYDTRCKVKHSHVYNLWQYYKRERYTLRLRYKILKLKEGINITCKIKKIFLLKTSLIKKIGLIIKLIIYYIIKLIAIAEIYLFDLIKKNP